MKALVVGEALIDIIVTDTGSVEHPGGSPLNVAVGLARLGFEANVHTAIGNDARGDVITAHARASGVAVTTASRVDAMTNTATAVLDADGAATYEFSLDAQIAPLTALAAVDVVHTGSIGAVVGAGAVAVGDLLAAARAISTISYDPNVRPSVMDAAGDVRSLVEERVGQSDVVKASDEDLEWLYPERSALDSARAWSRLGPALVVLTSGAAGADGVASERTTHVAVPRVTVVDTVGAGDSFMAGLIAALGDRGLLGAQNRAALAAISIEQLESVLTFAARCAAVTVTRAGANPPSRVELD